MDSGFFEAATMIGVLHNPMGKHWPYLLVNFGENCRSFHDRFVHHSKVKLEIARKAKTFRYSITVGDECPSVKEGFIFSLDVRDEQHRAFERGRWKTNGHWCLITAIEDDFQHRLIDSTGLVIAKGFGDDVDFTQLSH